MTTNTFDYDRDIAVIGMGLEYPFASTVSAFWEQLLSKRTTSTLLSSCRQNDINNYIDAFHADRKNYTKNGISFLNRIDMFDYQLFHMSPKEASFTDPNHRLFLTVAYRAFEDAGYNHESLNGTNTGVYVGYSPGAQYVNELNYTQMAAEIDSSSLQYINNGLPMAIAGRLSYVFNLKGPAVIIDTACSSSLSAIHIAVQALRNKECTMAVAGGVRLFLGLFKNDADMGIESKTGFVRAFDQDANGTVAGEGVAAVILKPLNKAQQDHDHIYAVIKGSAMNQDGTTMGMTVPNPAAQEAVLESAWKDGCIVPENISFLEAHGTGTKVGDPIELLGMERAFEKYTQRKQFCAVGTVKTNLGHLDYAAGITGFIKAVLSINKRVLPATLHFHRPNQHYRFESSPLYINDQHTAYPDSTFLIGGVSSFGLGGTNCHIIISQGPVKEKTNNSNNRYFIFTVSASNSDNLVKTIQNYISFLEHTTKDISDICYTSCIGRPHLEKRLALVTSTRDDLRKQLLQFLDKRDLSNLSTLPERQQYQVLCEQYSRGGTIDWLEIYPEKDCFCKISLPGIVMEEKRCWFLDEHFADDQWQKQVRNHYFHKVQWVPCPQHVQYEAPNARSTHIIVLAYKNKTSIDICQVLQTKYNDITIAWITNEVDFGQEHVHLRWNNKDDLLEMLDRVDFPSVHIITLSPLEAVCGNRNSLQDLEHNLNIGVYHLHFLLSVCAAQTCKSIQISIITQYAIPTPGTSPLKLRPELFAISSVIKTAHLEQNEIAVKMIDFDEEFHCDNLLSGLQVPELVLAYRKNQRYKQILNPVIIADTKHKPVGKNMDTILIAGGLGDLGLAIANHYAKRKNTTFIMINRTQYPGRDQWNQSIENSNIQKAICEIQDIEALGSTVDIIKADVSDYHEMQQAFHYIRGKYQKIDLIIHCAGIMDFDTLLSGDAKNGSLLQKSHDDIKNGLAAKINGTWLLDEFTQQYSPDMILFSSVASIFGAPGQAEYAAANAYLDGFAVKRNASGRRTLSLNWTTWKERGIGKQYGKNVDGNFYLLSTRDALAAYDLSVNTDEINLLIGKINTGFPVGSLYKSVIQLPDVPLLVSQDKPSQQNQPNALKNNREFDIESTVLSIFCQVLGFERLDTTSNFYKLGGDSMVAVSISEKISKKTNTEIDAHDILQTPVIHDLIEIIQNRYLEKSKVQDAGQKATKINDIPATVLQQELFYVCQYDKTSTVYNLPVALKISGLIDHDKIINAIENLVQRHEALRTSFQIKNKTLIQQIHEKITIDITFEEGELQNTDTIIASFIRPFDLNKAPLFRILIVSDMPSTHLFLFDIHHIVSDAISTNIMVHDIIEHYEGNHISQNQPLQYREYIEWQYDNKDKLTQDNSKYWEKVFKEPYKKLAFPVDFTSQSNKSYHGNFIEYVITQTVYRKLLDLAAQYDITFYHLLLSAYGILINHFTGAQDIVIGTAVSGRPSVDFNKTVGLFVRSLPLRLQIGQEEKFTQLLQYVKKSVLSMHENQNVPDEQLKLILSDSEAFNTMFILQNIALRQFQTADFKAVPYAVYNRVSKFDFTMEARKIEDKFTFRLEYKTNLFRKNTAISFMESFIQILSIIAENPNQRVNKIKPEIQFQIGNDTIAPTSNANSQSLDCIFTKCAGELPERTAILSAEGSLTYKELHKQTNQMANMLIKHGVSKNEIVGIRLSRSQDFVIAVLGILKAKAICLPIPPDFPPNRVDEIITDSGISYAVINNSLHESCNQRIQAIEVSDRHDYPDHGLSIDDGTEAAFVVYTSGSTGCPKGVLLGHAALYNQIQAKIDMLSITRDDRISFNLGVGFVASIWQMFAPLISGAAMVIYPQESYCCNFFEFINKHRTTVTQITPSLLNAQMAVNPNCRLDQSHLRALLLTGEAVTVPLVERYYQNNSIPLYNTYGLTETSDDIIQGLVQANHDKEHISIGSAIPNVNLHILSNQADNCSQDETGELYVSGEALALGYLNDPMLTYKMFPTLAYLNNTRVLKTGDLISSMNGELFYRGRRDFQIKMNGNRINIQEVERVLRGLTGVIDAAIVVDEPNAYQVSLTAFVVNGNIESADKLYEIMKKSLPSYMVPKRLFLVNTLPITQNGKLDRHTLQSWSREKAVQTINQPDIMDRLKNTWKSILDKEDIDISDNFFETGGNSLLALVLANEIQQNISPHIELKDVVDHASIAEMTRIIEEKEIPPVNS